MKWIAGDPETRGWYLVWTVNEQYDHLPTGWCKAWFDGKEWDKHVAEALAPSHRVTHWILIVGPGA